MLSPSALPVQALGTSRAPWAQAQGRVWGSGAGGDGQHTAGPKAGSHASAPAGGAWGEVGSHWGSLGPSP